MNFSPSIESACRPGSSQSRNSSAVHNSRCTVAHSETIFGISKTIVAIGVDANYIGLDAKVRIKVGLPLRSGFGFSSEPRAGQSRTVASGTGALLLWGTHASRVPRPVSSPDAPAKGEEKKQSAEPPERGKGLRRRHRKRHARRVRSPEEKSWVRDCTQLDSFYLFCHPMASLRAESIINHRTSSLR